MAEIEAAMTACAKRQVPMDIETVGRPVPTDAVPQFGWVGVVISPFRRWAATVHAFIGRRVAALNPDTFMERGVFDVIAAPLRIPRSTPISASSAPVAIRRFLTSATGADSRARPIVVLRPGRSLPIITRFDAVRNEPSGDSPQRTVGLSGDLPHRQASRHISLRHPRHVLVKKRRAARPIAFDQFGQPRGALGWRPFRSLHTESVSPS